MPADMPGMADDPNDTAGIERMSTEADGNQDGVVDFEEMVSHEESDVAKARLHLGDADRDGDGSVTMAEWTWHNRNSPLHTSHAGHARHVACGGLVRGRWRAVSKPGCNDGRHHPHVRDPSRF